MLRYSVPFVFLLTAACLETPAPEATTAAPAQNGVARAASSGASVPSNSCENPSSPVCAFINSPVKLSSVEKRLPGRKFPFFPTVQPLQFVDSSNRNWNAPIATLTDGASIPPMFVKYIGAPTSREFMNAATIHDAYCGVGNEKGKAYHRAAWQDVHRMFYDALRVGGTPAIKAKIMYTAVYLGGPRWAGSRRARINPSDARRQQVNRPLTSLVQQQALVKKFLKAKAYIEANNPPIAQLELYLTEEERTVRFEAPLVKEREH